MASFYGGVAEMFERWVERQANKNTRRGYRRDVLDFVEFLSIRWPDDAHEILRVSVGDVQRWRDGLIAAGRAPKTLHRRVCSLSSFFKYLAGSAAELRLPVNMPNPAHSQFIARSSADPVVETPALTLSQARQLQEMPKGDDLIAWRDRAIIDFYLYTGARIATGCSLTVADFHDVEGNPTIRLRAKGNKTQTVGLHWRAADSIRRYIDVAKLDRGPLFRARANSRSPALSEATISNASMYRTLQHYLSRLPKAMDGGECRYHPHVLRATTATLLLEKGEDIRKVQELLGHRNVTTTQVYDKRRISTKQSASHDVPI
jgi:integrase/recombinase XerD